MERAIDRLKAFAKYANGKGVVNGQNSFEKYCGLSNGYIANLDKGGKGVGSIGSDVIAKLLKVFPELNVRWLCTGEGDMLDANEIAKGKLEQIRGIIAAG
jgi:hypothetical protein